MSKLHKTKWSYFRLNLEPISTLLSVLFSLPFDSKNTSIIPAYRVKTKTLKVVKNQTNKFKDLTKLFAFTQKMVAFNPKTITRHLREISL